MTNCHLEICSCPYLTSKIHKGNVGCYSYDEATVYRYKKELCVHQEANMPFLRPEYGPLEPVLCPCFILVRLESLKKDICFLKRCNTYLVLLRWDGGREKRSWNLYEIFYRNYSEPEPRLEKLLIHLGICQCCN